MSGHKLVTITTFLGREAPPPNTVIPTNGILIDTVMTASGQLVGFKVSRNMPRPSTATCR